MPLGAPFSFQPLQGISDPRSFPGTQAWYDISDLSSLRNNAGAVPSNGEGIKLIGDKSGNSATNALVLNGVAGKYASAPDAAYFEGPSELDIELDLSSADYTPGSTMYFVAHYRAAGNDRCYRFGITTAGNLLLGLSIDGVNEVNSQSTVALGFPDFTRGQARVTWNGITGEILFYYRNSSGDAWAQLGASVVSGVTGPLYTPVASLPLIIGAGSTTGSSAFVGSLYRIILRTTINGASVFDANFTAVPKLATSFTESSSNAATVTINTTGDLGARISGARDLVQMTSTKQPVLTVSATGNFLTFDGTDDYMKAASFLLVQPTAVYGALSQITWTSNDKILDGNTLDMMDLFQSSVSPRIRLFAGANGPISDSFVLDTRAVVSAIFNSASSLLRVNRGTAGIGDAGTSNANGFTLGARGDGAQPSNITFSEGVIRSTADATATQDAYILYLQRKWLIP